MPLVLRTYLRKQNSPNGSIGTETMCEKPLTARTCESEQVFRKQIENTRKS